MPKGFLTEEQFQVLRLAHKAQREKRLADRIKAVLMLHLGFTYSQITQALLIDDVTVRRYCKKYCHKGIDGLLEMHYTGGSTRLTLVQEQKLKLFLTTNTKRTAKEIVDHIVKAYQVKFSTIGITKLLHRLGFSYKKPKIVPGKANWQKQTEFLERYGEIKSTLRDNDQIYFIDSTHPSHNTKPSYGWILKGKANDKFVKTNSGRERLNLNGALNLKDKTAVVLEEKTINKLAVIKLLKKLDRLHPTGNIYLILDNASYHHAKIVTSWFSKHQRFKPIYLPPYSPNLNLIERLWGFFHRTVLWNHYFETVREFKQASLKFFKNLDLYQEELSTLLTDNFQLIPNLNLQT
ncbi:MAG: IS630 family transposase [Candidatus Woesebacteria bacterium]|nr:IS630 family transposase [Candidatus Woesebacteria bacterium]